MRKHNCTVGVTFVLIIFILHACSSNDKNVDMLHERVKFNSKVDKNAGVRYFYKSPESVFIPDDKAISLDFSINDSFAYPLTISSILDTANSRIIAPQNKLSLFGDISKIIFTAERLYILDSKKTRNVWIFNTTGEFISSIYDREANDIKGITAPEDFDVIDGKIFLIDQQAQLWKFNESSLKVEEKLKLPFIPNGLKGLDSVNVILHNSSMSYNQNNLLHVCLSDTSILSTNLPIKKSYFNTQRDQFPVRDNLGNPTILSTVFNDTIYSISKDTISPRYVLNFGNKSLPKNLPDSESFYKTYRKYRTRINALTYETEKYFSFSFSDRLIVWGVFNKQDKTTKYFKSIADDLFGGAFKYFPCAVKGDSLVFSLSRKQLYSMQKNGIINKNRGGIFAKLYREIEKGYEYDNDILIISKWR